MDGWGPGWWRADVWSTPVASCTRTSTTACLNGTTHNQKGTKHEKKTIKIWIVDNHNGLRKQNSTGLVAFSVGNISYYIRSRVSYTYFILPTYRNKSTLTDSRKWSTWSSARTSLPRGPGQGWQNRTARVHPTRPTACGLKSRSTDRCCWSRGLLGWTRGRVAQVLIEHSDDDDDCRPRLIRDYLLFTCVLLYT